MKFEQDLHVPTKVNRHERPSAFRTWRLSIFALMFTATFAGQASAEGLSDAQILSVYIQVNGFDIETALLGRSLGQTKEVRALAAHVSSDHLVVRQAALELAGKCKLEPALPASRVQSAVDHGNTLARLMSLSGGAFDKAYARHEVAFHTAAIDAVRNTLLPAAQCPELKAHLKTVLPAFEHHLAETKRLAAESAGR